MSSPRFASLTEDAACFAIAGSLEFDSCCLSGDGSESKQRLTLLRSHGDAKRTEDGDSPGGGGMEHEGDSGFIRAEAMETSSGML